MATLTQKRVMTGTNTFAFTAPPTLGNVMVLVAGSNGTATTPGFANDWRQAQAAGPNGANDERINGVFKIATAADVAANSWTISAFTTGTRGIIGYEFAGLHDVEVELLSLHQAVNDTEDPSTGPATVTLTGTVPTEDGVVISAGIMNATCTGEALTIDGSATGVVLDSIGNPMFSAYKLLSAPALVDAQLEWDWTESLRAALLGFVLRGTVAPEPEEADTYPRKVRRDGAWVDVLKMARRDGGWE